MWQNSIWKQYWSKFVYDRKTGGVNIHHFSYRNGEQYVFKVKRNAKVRNRYNQVTHLTLDTMWQSDKHTIKHNTQESQEVRPFPAGDNKTARNIQDNIEKTNITHK